MSTGDLLWETYLIPYLKESLRSRSRGVREDGVSRTDFENQRERSRTLLAEKLTHTEPASRRNRHVFTLKRFVEDFNDFVSSDAFSRSTDKPKDVRRYLDDHWMSRLDFQELLHFVEYDVCGHLREGDDQNAWVTCGPSYVDFVEDVLLPREYGVGDDFLNNHRETIYYRNRMMDEAESGSTTTEEPSSADVTKKSSSSSWWKRHAVLVAVFVVVATLVLVLAAIAFFAPRSSSSSSSS